MLESEMKWRKEAMTIRHGDCQCLPEMVKQMIEFALEEKLAVLSSNLKLHKDTAVKAPETFKALSKLFNYTFEDIEEEETEIASYEFLLQKIKGLPACIGQTNFMELPSVSWEKN
jgi:hypothetical protein